jgi:hypothetical protein
MPDLDRDGDPGIAAVDHFHDQPQSVLKDREEPFQKPLLAASRSWRLAMRLAGLLAAEHVPQIILRMAERERDSPQYPRIPATPSPVLDLPEGGRGDARLGREFLLLYAGAVQIFSDGPADCHPII